MQFVSYTPDLSYGHYGHQIWQWLPWRHDPQSVGVVGPVHKGRNMKSLTFASVHSTHFSPVNLTEKRG